jgi:alginate O-acetyltransferase complex protein AlgI
MPQFQSDSTYRWQFSNVSAGLAIFCLGLFKKVVIADGISPYADAVFNAADSGAFPSTAEAWTGALAYTFQLYFDFSGYSDMAIGLSWLFNVRLPFNFDSPYKSLNISEFWRRWHMTLSAFLRDYLYIPLGGNRFGPARRYLNLAVTMVLGGLWHGASWTFVFWGALHGAYLGVNHAFRAFAQRVAPRLHSSGVFAAIAWLVTFLAVVVAWVFFRAPTFAGALRVLEPMVNARGWHAAADANPLLWNAGLDLTRGLWLCALLGVIAVFAPNSNAIGENLREWCQRGSGIRSLVFGSAVTLVVFLVVLNESRNAVSAFIYFNF